MANSSKKRMAYTPIHIGSIIEEVIREQGRSPSWIAKELCCDRTNIYNILKRESVDTNLLLKLSSILNYNFFQHFTESLTEQDS